MHKNFDFQTHYPLILYSKFLKITLKAKHNTLIYIRSIYSYFIRYPILSLIFATIINV